MEGRRQLGAVDACKVPILGSRPPLTTLRSLSIALTAVVLLALALSLVRESGSGSGSSSGRGSGSGSDPDAEEYPWTDVMLTWQRPAFHFRTMKNYMNGKIEISFAHFILYFNFASFIMIINFDSNAHFDVVGHFLAGGFGLN